MRRQLTAVVAATLLCQCRLSSSLDVATISDTIDRDGAELPGLDADSDLSLLDADGELPPLDAEGELPPPGSDMGIVDGELGIDDDYVARSVSATESEVERFDDATTYFGDVEALLDMSSIHGCHQACDDNQRCVAWTLDKYRFICLLRLVRSPTVRYSGDYIGARLSQEEITARAERMNTAIDGAWALPPELAAPGVADNVRHEGIRLRVVPHIDHVLGCRDACVHDRRCAAATLDKRLSSCTLVHAGYSSSAANRSAGVISLIVEGRAGGANTTNATPAAVTPTPPMGGQQQPDLAEQSNASAPSVAQRLRLLRNAQQTHPLM